MRKGINKKLRITTLTFLLCMIIIIPISGCSKISYDEIEGKDGNVSYIGGEKNALNDSGENQTPDGEQGNADGAGDVAQGGSGANSAGISVPTETYGLDILKWIKRSYELKFLFAEEAFTSPSQISVNKLAQYALCHVFYENLTDMPQKNGITLKTATESQINKVLKSHFNLTGINVKQSDLYNPEGGLFEMWEPKYSQTIYADASCKKTGDSTYEIKTVFYAANDKSTQKGTTTLSIATSGGDYYITAMS